MKKVLFASTALVAFAGAAAADVTLSGNLEMGIIYNDDQTNEDVEFFTDADVTFTFAGETDGGLLFGGSVDLDEGGNLGNSRDDGGVNVFISGAFGTLTMGDTDGALDWALTEVAFNSGSINDDETAHAGYNGNSAGDGTFDGQILRYDYTVGNFGVAVSAELNDVSSGTAASSQNVVDATGAVIGTVDTPAVAGSDGDGDVYGIGFRYQVDFGGNTVNLGLGYQDVDGDDAVGLSVATSFGPVQAGISYVDFDGGTFDNHVGIGVGYSAGALSLSANYGMYEGDDSDNDQDGFGISAGYDLGGGAAIQFGYGDSNFDDSDNDSERMSLGLRMNF